jgi:hypothetical protein
MRGGISRRCGQEGVGGGPGGAGDVPAEVVDGQLGAARVGVAQQREAPIRQPRRLYGPPGPISRWSRRVGAHATGCLLWYRAGNNATHRHASFLFLWSLIISIARMHKPEGDIPDDLLA